MRGYDIDDKILFKYKNHLCDNDELLKDIGRVEKLHRGNMLYISQDNFMQTPIETHVAECKILFSDLFNYNIENVCAQIYQIADTLVLSVKKMVFTSLDNISNFSNNIVDGSGNELTEGMVFELLKKVYITFDDDGEPVLPVLNIAGKNFNIIDIFPNLKRGLSEEFDALIAQKKEEYYASKGCRRLSRVD